MKTTTVFTVLLVVLSVPAFAQLQKLNTSPAYDNVHREHSFEKKSFKNVRSYALIEAGNNPVEYHANYLRSNSEFMNIPFQKIQRNPEYINKSLPFYPAKTKYEYGLFLFSYPAPTPVKS